MFDCTLLTRYSKLCYTEGTMANHEAYRSSDHHPDAPPLVAPEIIAAYELYHIEPLPSPMQPERYIKIIAERDEKLVIKLEAMASQAGQGDMNKKRAFLMGAFSLYSLFLHQDNYTPLTRTFSDDDVDVILRPSVGRHVDRSTDLLFLAPPAPEPDPLDE